MTKIKKLIKNNWIIYLYYLIGFAGAVIIGWLLGRPNMLHATAFSGSSITYNEEQTIYAVKGNNEYATILYCNIVKSSSSTNNYGMSCRTYSYNAVTGVVGNNTGLRNYFNGNISSNVITFSKLLNYTVNTSATSLTPISNTYTLTISSTTASFTDSSLSNLGDFNILSAGGYTQQDLDQAYADGIAYVIAHPADYGLYTSAQYTAYGTEQYNLGIAYVIAHPADYGLYTSAQYSANYTAGQNSVINDPNTYNLYTQEQYNTNGNNNYNSGYTAGQNAVINDPNTYNLYTANQRLAYGEVQYQNGINYVVQHPSEYNLYTQVQYEYSEQLGYDNGYDDGYNDGLDNATYNDGYQAGITQGENNVTSSPNDYGLYTEQQYINNSQFSDYILQNIDSVWINQPVYNSQSGYWESNWVKINNNNLTIQDGTIRLDNIYSNYTNVAEIQIFFKSYFTNDIPLTVKNILDPSVYNQTSIDLYCYNQLPTDTWLSGLGVMCQVIPGLTSNVNGTEIEYSSLINNTNYFDAMYGSTDEMAYFTNMKYNSIGIRRWSVVGSPMLYLNSEINEINFDISGINFTSYNLGYSKGYTTGQQANQQSVYNEGFNDGYDKAVDLYEDTSGNGNTLVGLAGTILFSPVNMMKDIFNFEILGVNLAGFVLSIITLFVVIWLIKRLI